MAALAFLTGAFVGTGATAHAADEGALDPTWDGDGIRIDNFGNVPDAANAVVVQGDGKVVVAGVQGLDMLVARYTAAGVPDTTFSTDGSTTIDFGGRDSAFGVAVLADSSIVVVGLAASGEPETSVAALAKLTPAGALDTTFSEDGKQTTDIPGGTGDVWESVALGAGGTLVTAGSNNGPGATVFADAGETGDIAVGRYVAAGTPDLTFDTDGLQLVNVGDLDMGHAVQVAADGTVTVAGGTGIGNASNVVVVRLTAAGALDTGFDGDGVATTNVTAGDEAFDLVLQPDGKIVVAGVAGDNFLVVRYTTAGALDTSFSTDGIATADFGGDDIAFGLVLDGGSPTLGGVGGAGNGHFALARFTSGGALDPTFGGDGTVLTTIGGASAAHDLAITADGRHVAAGFSATSTDPNTTVVRYAEVQPDPRSSGAGQGYWLAASDGGIFSFDAEFSGSTGNIALNSPVVGMAPDLDGEGYWLVAADGGVFAFEADFEGSMGAQRLNRPIVGMAADTDGEGYWLVASDGGIFAFDATFHGSTGNIPLNSPIVGMAADPDGQGYWLVARDGGVFAFDADFEGSMGAQRLNSPVVGMAADPDGEGYWLVASDGGIFSFDATFSGSTGAIRLNSPIVGIAADPDGRGYWLGAADGGVFAFDAAFRGSMGAVRLNRPVVAIAAEPTV